MRRLLASLPPDREATLADWATTEEQLATTIPEPCRDLANSYGESCFDDFLWILHPASENENLNLVSQTRTARSALVELAEELTLSELQELGLDIDDLVAWGFTDNGDFCYTAATETDDNPLTLVNESRSPDWAVFRNTPGDFLYEIIAGETTCSIFPDDFPSENPTLRHA